MKIKVIFEYDEIARKWEVFVQGATSNIDALQAFNAVVITSRSATPKIECNKAIPMDTPGEYKISIGI